MDPANPLDLLREFGSLGLLGYVVWWLLRKLNGKIDRLALAVEKAAEGHESLERALRDATAAQRELTRHLTKT